MHVPSSNSTPYTRGCQGTCDTHTQAKAIEKLCTVSDHAHTSHMYIWCIYTIHAQTSSVMTCLNLSCSPWCICHVLKSSLLHQFSKQSWLLHSFAQAYTLTKHNPSTVIVLVADIPLHTHMLFTSYGPHTSDGQLWMHFSCIQMAGFAQLHAYAHIYVHRLRYTHQVQADELLSHK